MNDIPKPRMEIDTPTRKALELALSMLMSDWSESWYCASWLVCLEDTLPKWCKANPDDDWAIAMTGIANLLGYWVRRNYNNTPYTVEPYTPPE